MSLLRYSFIITMIAIAVRYVPTLFTKSKIAVGQGGYAAPAWVEVGRTFKNMLDSGEQQGGSFAIFHRGQLVVNFYGGFADEEAHWTFSEDTLVPMYSTTKGLGAIVIAKLVETGLLDYKATVASYWPEFAQNGKEKITVEQLISHQAGLSYTEEKFSLLDIDRDPQKVGRILAQQKPIWPPGEGIGYHGFTLGFYEDQLVRHVDARNRSLSQYFHEEIALPFDVDAYIGLPQSEHHRCCRSHEPGSLQHFWDAKKYWPAYWQFLTNSSSVVRRSIENIQDSDNINMNNPSYRSVTSVSGGGFSTALAMARLYGILANGGQVDDQTLLSVPMIKSLTEPLATGFDQVFSFDITYGRGVTLFKNPSGQFIFGTPGAGGQMAYADPHHQLGWAYLTNYNSLNDIGDDPRYLKLEKAMYQAVHKLEQKEKEREES